MKNNLNLLMDTILGAPAWIQEALYIDLGEKLKEKIPTFDLSYSLADSYPIYRPKITFKGKQELQNHDMGLDFNVYKYLNSLMEELRVIDITLNNFWTLEESSKYLIECIKNEFVTPPTNTVLLAEIYYLSGEIKIGEFVKRINKINVEELDMVLRKQKQYNLEHPDEKIKTGELLVDMGYVANNDIEKILYVKDESKKRYIVSCINMGGNESPESDAKIEEINELNQKLLAENKFLKDKLRAVFNIQNKNKQA